MVRVVRAVRVVRIVMVMRVAWAVRVGGAGVDSVTSDAGCL